MPVQNKRALLYARCSTNKDQKPELQLDEMKRFCSARSWTITKEISDSGWSGTTDKRPGLKNLMDLARTRQVDVVVVLKLDRLFRSLNHLITTLQEFSDLGVEFVSIKDQIDLSTSAGKLMLYILAAFAEFEVSLIRERTILGLAHAVSKGKKLGRPRSPLSAKIIELRAKGLSYRAIAKQLNCSMGVVCRSVQSAPKTPADSEQKTQVETRVEDDQKMRPDNGR